MPEYGFSPTRFFLYNNKIFDSVLIQENSGQKSPYSCIYYAVTIYTQDKMIAVSLCITCLKQRFETLNPKKLVHRECLFKYLNLSCLHSYMCMFQKKTKAFRGNRKSLSRMHHKN